MNRLEQITGKPMSELANLRGLDLRNNQLKSIPSEIGELAKLVLLDLDAQTRIAEKGEEEE